MKFRCGDWEKAVNMGFFSVFPAQAGVIPVHDIKTSCSFRIPRASGGDPRPLHTGESQLKYSPRKRG